MAVIEQAESDDIQQLCCLDEIVLGSSRRADFLVRSVHEKKVWVSKIEGRIVGFITMDPSSFFGNPFIEILIVHPDFRKQGIGTLLIRKMESECLSAKLFTSTNQSNKTMQRLCESLDFIRSGYIDNLDEGDPEFIYVKRVKSFA